MNLNWTAEDRLKVIAVLAGIIQMDIPAGNYGALISDKPMRFRPNMQSIIEVIFADAAQLERNRASIEELIREELGAEAEAMFAKSLDEIRSERP